MPRYAVLALVELEMDVDTDDLAHAILQAEGDVDTATRVLAQDYAESALPSLSGFVVAGPGVDDIEGDGRAAALDGAHAIRRYSEISSPEARS